MALIFSSPASHDRSLTLCACYVNCCVSHAGHCQSCYSTKWSWRIQDWRTWMRKTKSITSLRSTWCCVVDVRLMIGWSRPFNCSLFFRCFLLFIGGDQLCLSWSWGVQSTTITGVKEFEIERRIGGSVFTGILENDKRLDPCLQDDNKFHHGRQRAHCQTSGRALCYSQM